MSLPECISGYFNGCEMISHRNFDLDFPHNSAEHFFGYLFSICMSSLEIYLSPLTIKKNMYFLIELYEFIVYFRYQIIRQMACRYYLPLLFFFFFFCLFLPFHFSPPSTCSPMEISLRLGAYTSTPKFNNS